MKNTPTIIILSILLTIFSLNSCKKYDSLPVVATRNVINIIDVEATCGGEIISPGESDIVLKGVCWSTNPKPTISDSFTSYGSGNTPYYRSTITGLLPNTIYYVRAYATNAEGVGYGSIESFRTKDYGEPIIKTSDITNITNMRGTSGGNIIDDGGLPITLRGLCWSMSTNPSISDYTFGNSSGLGTFTNNVIGLQPNTRYYVRAFATNAKGTFYGDEKSFTTLF